MCSLMPESFTDALDPANSAFARDLRHSQRGAKRAPLNEMGRRLKAVKAVGLSPRHNSADRLLLSGGAHLHETARLSLTGRCGRWHEIHDATDGGMRYTQLLQTFHHDSCPRLCPSWLQVNDVRPRAFLRSGSELAKVFW
jgi:hypothetical protein